MPIANGAMKFRGLERSTVTFTGPEGDAADPLDTSWSQRLPLGASLRSTFGADVGPVPELSEAFCWQKAWSVRREAIRAVMSRSRNIDAPSYKKIGMAFCAPSQLRHASV